MLARFLLFIVSGVRGAAGHALISLCALFPRARQRGTGFES